MPNVNKSKNSGKKSGKAVSTAKPKSKAQKKTPSKGIQLSPCSWHFARAVFDPFNTPPGACIPSLPAMPSKKLMTWIRGSFQAGTTGFGFVVANPFSGVSITPATALVTGSAYTGSTIVTSTTTGVTAVSSNSPYTSSYFGTTVGTARLVGFGIRIRYSGALLYRQGVAYPVQLPTHGSLAGLAVAQLASLQRVEPVVIGSDWINIAYTPLDVTDIEAYVPSTSSSLDGSTGAGFLAVAVDGVNTTNGNSFQYEIYGHYEANIRSISDMTPSESDPVGLGFILNAAGHVVKDGFIGQIDTGRLWNQIVQTGAQAVSNIAMYSLNNMLRSRLQGAPAGAPRIEEM